jgi:hypothetical protein
MDQRETDLLPGSRDRRAFLRRMVAAGFALPAIATFESVFAAHAAADHDKCHDHPHGHGPGGGHGHEDCTTTTPAPTTTTPAPQTTTISAP